MDFRKKLEAMVEGLRTNPRGQVLEAVFADPAAPAEIEQARDLAKGSLPEGVEELYRQMNGFRLRWQQRAPETQSTPGTTAQVSRR